MTDAQLLDPNLPPCQLGEGACWDELTGRLYWVDILGRRVHSYDPETAIHQEFVTPSDVSFVFPAGPDMLILGLRDGVYTSYRAGGSLTPVALLDLPDEHRLNDGKIGPEGRLWVGTICTAENPTETAALYRLDATELVTVEGGYVNANGKGWSPDGGTLYHADTDRHTVWQYSYNPLTGEIAEKRTFLELGGESPDGLCVDADGRVLVALYGSATVAVYSASGDFVHEVKLPVPNVTSCVIGGRELNTLFLTTAWDGLDASQRQRFPLSGQMFSVTVRR